MSFTFIQGLIKKVYRRMAKKPTIGLIIKKKNTFARASLFFVHFFAVVLHAYNVNFRKLPSYKFYGENVVPALVHFFLSLPLIFTLVTAGISRFFTAAAKFSCCSSNKWLLIARSNSLSLFFSLSFAGLSPSFSFSLSLSLYSKFVYMTINLS